MLPFSLHMSPIPRAFWVSQGFLSSPSDAAPSLTGFVLQEEEKVIPQLPPKAPAYGQCWAELQGAWVGKEKESPTTRAPLPGQKVRASSQGGLIASIKISHTRQENKDFGQPGITLE